MRYCLRLAWRNLTTRPAQSLATIIVVALTIGLALVVMQLNSGLSPIFTQLSATAATDSALVKYLINLVVQEHQILQLLGNFSTIIAATTLFLAIYSASSNRERLLAVMRSLGAQRRTILLVVIFETILLAFLGAVFGRAFSYALITAILTQVNQAAVIPVTLQYGPQVELWFWLAPTMLGIAAGLLPAVQAYRSNVVEKLFPG